MSQSIKESNSSKDILIFILSLAVLSSAVGYYFFVDIAQEDDTYQLLTLAAGVVLFFVVAYQSSYGHRLWHYFREARFELRKIVWPDRQSALINSALVFVLVIVAGIYFWLLDTFFRWIVWSLLGFE